MNLTVRKALDCVRARPIWLIVLLLSACGPAFGQDKAQAPQLRNIRIQQLAELSQPRTADIPIGAGDLLRIDVFDVPDLSREVRVSDSGMISLPLIPQRIPSAGCSPYQLENKLAQLLQSNGLVRNPQVSIVVKEQNSQAISVVGAVGHPMVYHEFGPTSLLQVLAAAGGVSNDAGDSILITREVAPPSVCGAAAADPPADPPADARTMSIRLSDLLQSGDPAFNIPVYGGDVITVPRAGVIYVAGAVSSPGGYTLHDPNETLNTMKAIAMAHGMLGTAKANDAVILRKDPATGETKEIKVKLKAIMQRKTPDVRLYANDILFVPDSTGKKILGRAAEAAVGITTGLAILKGAQ
jgi:polysaccharide biosynthesis/export protein